MDTTEKVMPEVVPQDQVPPPTYKEDGSGPVPPRLRALHDSNVSFHEYQYYARLTRQEQDNLPPAKAGKNFLAYLIPNLQKSPATEVERVDLNTSNPEMRKHITDEEWENASRALRTATAGAIFYLITTDILGPFGLPYAFATTGWGPGIALYTVFGVMAGFSGYLLWDCFMGRLLLSRNSFLLNANS